jgi:hypothetical protein
MAYRSLLSLCVALAWVALACTGPDAQPDPRPVTAARAPLISRTDSRQPPDSFADTAFAAQARGFVAALVLDEDVDQDAMGAPVLLADPLYLDHERSAGTELCRDERFALEPTAAFCTATLIAEDLVLTAGHCVLDQIECDDTTVIFGYEASTSSALQPLDPADIYGCAELLVMSSGSGSAPDYAVLRLDRAVPDREPARVARDVRSLPLGFPIAIAGHPIGLPLKITDDGEVVQLPDDYEGQEPEYFGADIDTFPGNSGSGAFFDGTGAPRALVGILSASLTFARYRHDYQRDCDRYERWPSVTIWLTYAHRAVAALCEELSLGSYPELCGCGDDSCDVAHEDGAVCAADCGDTCGDALCLGSESAETCEEDCPTCGDGTCGLGEDCCADCGCADGFVCTANACAPDIDAGAREGWTCDAPIEIAPISAELEGSTIGALRRQLCDDEGSGSCYGAERHYAFTLSAPATLTAEASGFSHIALAIRIGECDPRDAAFEQAIDRAGTGAARLQRVLQPGTYQLTVEGEGRYDEGDYQLDLDFAEPSVRQGDECVDAVELTPSGSYVVSGDTSLAANDYSGGSSSGCPIATFGNDQFYSFTLTEKTRVTAAIDAEHDASLRLLRGCTGDTLRCEASPAELSRVLDPGTYVLHVDGQAQHDSGSYALALEFLTSPPLTGESCEDALPLTPTAQQHIAGTVLGADDDADAHCTSTTSGDRVYTFTISDTRTVRISGTGDVGVRVDISAACPFADGYTCLPLAATTRSFNQTLDPGTYFVIIDAQTPGVGAYDLTLDFESEPAGESCIDAIPLPLRSAPSTMTRPGSPLSNVTAVHYRIVLPEPSSLTLSAADPAQLLLDDGVQLFTRPTGDLAMNTAAGSYCLRVYAPLGTPSLQLTGSATALIAPDGRGCDDAIPLSVATDHELSGYTGLGGLDPNDCTSYSRQFYAFELTERTRVHAVATSGSLIGVYEDAACTDLAYCTAPTSSSSLNEIFEPGTYRLFVLGYALIPYQLSLDFDCDSDDDGACDASDGCPFSPGKTAPGQCGCSRPDTDPDGDGVASCVDPCPDVPGTTVPCERPDSSVPDASLPDASAPMLDAMIDPHEDDDAGYEDAGQDSGPWPADASVADAAAGEDGAVAMTPDSGVTAPRDAGFSDPSEPLDAGGMELAAPRDGCDCNVVAARASGPRSWLGLALASIVLAARSRRRAAKRR